MATRTQRRSTTFHKLKTVDLVAKRQQRELGAVPFHDETPLLPPIYGDVVDRTTLTIRQRKRDRSSGFQLTNSDKEFLSNTSCELEYELGASVVRPELGNFEAAASRVEAFSCVFDSLITRFPLFGPLLAEVKREYDQVRPLSSN